jgi:ferredoxin
MYETLDMLTRPRGREQGQDALLRFQAVIALGQLAKVAQDTALCGLGMTAANPVLSTLRWFRDEYEQHVFARRCPAGVCSELAVYDIDPAVCTGCGLCRRRCPAQAIAGQAREAHVIDHDKCVSCGACRDECKFSAISREA